MAGSTRSERRRPGNANPGDRTNTVQNTWEVNEKLTTLFVRVGIDTELGSLPLRGAFGETHSVDLVQPDFLAVCTAFGVPARAATPETLAEDLAWALEVEGPAVVVLRTTVEWIQT